MSVLLQQLIFDFDNDNSNYFSLDEEVPYFHFDVSGSIKRLKRFNKAKNKGRKEFETILLCLGLHNLEKSIQQSSCDEISVEKLIHTAFENNNLLSKRKFISKNTSKKLKNERKALKLFRKIYFSLTDLEKIAIGRGKELPNLSMNLILQLSKLTSQN
ncbi:hypothetical protein M0813_00513 [Anaeramoeba flamelloides]|uniref:Uncharacterized protein n=1 Tax=Anaeramoeba flamelloides TaxID=1746091 RepID=A0AAV7Z524_9EUKA|nr:hypothetical protein M0812_01845 [Anaeramoeba flamelloides]KAJ6241807.1 hypothetical protein M0813_00513 [Anaeramoeba flamelloides]